MPQCVSIKTSSFKYNSNCIIRPWLFLCVSTHTHVQIHSYITAYILTLQSAWSQTSLNMFHHPIFFTWIYSLTLNIAYQQSVNTRSSYLVSYTLWFLVINAHHRDWNVTFPINAFLLMIVFFIISSTAIFITFCFWCSFGFSVDFSYFSPSKDLSLLFWGWCDRGNANADYVYSKPRRSAL